MHLVSSVEPSWAIMTSFGKTFCANTLLSDKLKASGQLYVDIIRDDVGFFFSII
jgi:hypothetical protein